MSETPSKRRRQGREAFSPGANPMELHPYKRDSWSYQYYLRDWLDGWDEAEKAYNESERSTEMGNKGSITEVQVKDGKVTEKLVLALPEHFVQLRHWITDTDYIESVISNGELQLRVMSTQGNPRLGVIPVAANCVLFSLYRNKVWHESCICI